MADAPQVERLEWGTVEVAGGDTYAGGSYKDAKLWPGGARGWDWNETGTSHSPGVQVADVEELLQHGAEIVVLSRGQQGRLQVSTDVVTALRDRGVDVEVAGTQEAVARYNELAAEGRAVGALIHSTC